MVLKDEQQAFGETYTQIIELYNFGCAILISFILRT